MRPAAFLCLVSLLAMAPLPLAAETIYVPDDYQSIQGAIHAAADGDTIVVRPGTYADNIDFLGKVITVQSAEGAEATIIDGGQQGSVVSFTHGEGQDTVLRGFTLTGGSGTPDDEYLFTRGGAILCLSSSPTIEACRLMANAADLGGGLACQSASPSLEGCEIRGNLADNGGGVFCRDSRPRLHGGTIAENTARDFGGGIYCWQSSPVISGNTITGNSTQNAGGQGGGIYAYLYSSPAITHNTISGNTASDAGGGILCLRYSSPPISGNTISGNAAGAGGGIRCLDFSSPTITGNLVTGNAAAVEGGGIACLNGSSPVIAGNTITGNTAGADGGGIACNGSNPAIRGNSVADNESGDGGGGISCRDADPQVADNLITGNSAQRGGGIHCVSGSAPVVTSCALAENSAVEGGGICSRFNSAPVVSFSTLTGNEASSKGGGAFCHHASSLIFRDSILWGDVAPQGAEAYAGDAAYPSSLGLDHCDVGGGIGSLFLESGCLLDWGAGMIDADPLFVARPRSGYYLSQTEAGQGADSPCLDAGDPLSPTPLGTTRTDSLQDAGEVDMGYHFPTGCLVAGPGPAPDNPPLVRVFPLEPGAQFEYQFSAYGPRHYGVNVTCADLNGDGATEILTGAGPGAVFGPHVRGFAVDGSPIPGVSFMAYGTQRFGVNVAAGDLDGDGYDEIVTGAGPGEVFGPHVRAFDYDEITPVRPIPGVSFIAYGTHKWGVNVAAGDVDGDGFDEIVTGPGPGAMFGAHVRGWNVDGGAAAAMPALSFSAYGTPRYGVVVGCGDLDGDGIEEIVTAPGPSENFGAHVRGWNFDGGAVTPLPGCSFFAWPPTQGSCGARVYARADLDGDGRAEIVVGGGPDPSAATPVQVFRYDSGVVQSWFGLQAFPLGWTQGTTVAAGRF